MNTPKEPRPGVTLRLRERLLRRALVANGLFCGLCIGVMLVGGEGLASAMGLAEAWPLWLVAAGLAPFSITVIWTGTAPTLDRRVVHSATLGDWAWVLGSAALLTFAAEQFSVLGIALITGVALCVAGFAIAQGQGMRRVVAAMT